LSFRDRLATGSGFQSFQFRELESELGVRNPASLDRYPPGSDARARIERRFAEPALWDAFLKYIAKRGHPVPVAQLERDVRLAIVPSPEVQRTLIDIYRNDPLVSSLCERLVDLDEGI